MSWRIHSGLVLWGVGYLSLNIRGVRCLVRSTVSVLETASRHCTLEVSTYVYDKMPTKVRLVVRGVSKSSTQEISQPEWHDIIVLCVTSTEDYFLRNN